MLKTTMTSPDSKLPSPSKATSNDSHLSGYAAQSKGKTGFKRIINAAGYSKDGLVAAYRHEAAFRQVTWLNAVLLVVIMAMPFLLTIKMLLVFASFFSLVVELFNTGIEASIDHTSTERHPLAKIGKDVGSAAQFLALMMLLILWVMAIYSVV
jgi:diacylglycerol kinase (ATP)